MGPKQKQKKSVKDHPVPAAKDKLSGYLLSHGVRPTRQRLGLSTFLFDGIPKHVTAEELLKAARRQKVRISLATVYNSLNQFVKAGMLKEVVFGRSKTFFDTNTVPHHHFYDESSSRLWDIPEDQVKVETVALKPYGLRGDHIEVTFYLTKDV